MSNRPIGEVSVGWRKEWNALGVNFCGEIALTVSAAFILFEIENYFDINTRSVLDFEDELLDWLTKTSKILRSHISSVLAIRHVALCARKVLARLM